MVVRKAYFIDADYVVHKEQTYARLLLKGKRKSVRLLYQYDPYFYVEAPEDKKDDLLSMEIYGKDGESISPKEMQIIELKVGQEKRRLIKFICKQPKDVALLREAIPFKCYEHNIPYAKRFIFDFDLIPQSVIKYEREGRFIKKIISINEEYLKLRTAAFDIETYNPIGAPREKQDPVIMASYAGETEGVITYKKSKKKFVEHVTDEKELIKRLSEVITKEDPDILFGYNSTNFDIPYLIARANANKCEINLGRFSGKI